LLAQPNLRAERAAAAGRTATLAAGVLDAVEQHLARWLDQMAPLSTATMADPRRPIRMPV
jgi:hypothetical protein